MTDTETEAKPTKRQANYRKALTQRSCHNCHYMNPDGTCDRLAGQPRVSKTYVCNLWKAK